MDMFTGRILVLATMHGKEKVIAPILEKQLGVKVIVPKDFNSDQFGTFTRDKKRTGTQLEAARLKVKTAMKTMGADLGIASEGSFGSDPNIPFVPSNLELILLVDEKNNLEIRGHSRSSDTNISGRYVKSIDEARAFAKQIGFPEHGLIVRKSEKSNRPLYKGIRTQEELEQRVHTLLRGFFAKKVYLETDMRAHMNPTRMQNIQNATEDLVKNIQSECPDCGTPGFVVVGTKGRLLCRHCKQETESPRAYIKKCQKCALEKEVPREDKIFEEPALCERCNP
ncbi:MAG: DUF6671 family protein [bacterium]